jgi:hypothetical protein
MNQPDASGGFERSNLAAAFWRVPAQVGHK